MSENYEKWKPHSFHLNLPSHHKDPEDGIPWITKFAHKRSRAIVKLIHEIKLTEDLFYNNENEEDCEDEDEDDIKVNGDDDDYDDDDIEVPSNEEEKEEKASIGSIIKKCSRVHSQLNVLQNLKYSGITQMELCEMLLHILKLLTATVSIKNATGDDDEDKPDDASFSNNNKDKSPKKRKKEFTLHFDDVGYIHNFNTEKNEENVNVTETTTSPKDIDAEASKLENYLKHPFALPSPARETLLSIAFLLISKKGRLSSVSNAAIFVDGEVRDRKLLIIHWKALLRMLLRTAPYLDEHKVGMPPIDSASRKNSVVKKTVNLIRQCRRFFDQGLVQTAGKSCTDKTSREVWNMVKTDLMFHTHSNSSFRALIMLHLFQPSYSTSEYYNEVMPQWLESWSSIDRCPDFDSLWLAMFCRGRKFATNFHWGLLRTKLLTHCCYWIQIPLGGSSSDKSFPNASPARSRALPAKLKVFIGDGSQWTGFVGKIAKLLIFCLGRSDKDDALGVSYTKFETSQNYTDEEKCMEQTMSNGTADFLQFLSFVTPYFNPSNTGNWTFPLGALLHYLAFDFSHRMGMMAWFSSLTEIEIENHKDLFKAEVYLRSLKLPSNEIVAIFDILLPLCQQALYSKNSYVSRAGEAALFCLAHTDPLHVCPPFLNFLSQALHVSSVNLSHQAPAALSALSRLIQPSLRSNAPILLGSLQEILSLSLAGIDSNDENKTIRTLIFYRNIASWIPVGKIHFKQKSISPPEHYDGTTCIDSEIYKKNSSTCRSDEYFTNVEQLPETSLLRQNNIYDNFTVKSKPEASELESLNEETALTMSDWSLAFLDRLYALLRVVGEQEKVGKNTRGVARRHLSADASQARNFSRVLKECVVQIFSSMDAPTHESASRSVAKFLYDETVPMAAKDASAICEAVSSARIFSTNSKDNYSGLCILIPILIDNLQQISNKTAIYRIRCLSGAVRRAGVDVLKFREEIISAINYALADQDDKHLFKAGCKLLRHTLSSQCESYPISSDSCPHFNGQSDWGISAQLRDDKINWHVPCGDQIDFVAEILKTIVFPKMKELSKDLEQNNTQIKVNVGRWRRAFRVLRYSLRGCSGVLLDEYINTDDHEIFERYDPNEKATWQLLQSSSKNSVYLLCNFRRNICGVVSNMMALLAKYSYGTTSNAETDMELQDLRNTSSKINHEFINDPKLCKELSEIACILTTRRGASFRCQDTRYIWRSQKQILTDYTITAHICQLQSIKERNGSENSEGVHLYKDGEAGGKSLPRRLVVGRVEIFVNTIQRNSSFSVPRRLLRQRKRKSRKGTDFTLNASFESVFQSMNGTFDIATYTENPSSGYQDLDSYEGIVNGLFAMTCHQNVQVRSAAFGVVDYALSRFAWYLRIRTQRLLSCLSLTDEHDNGNFGLPACNLLSKQIDSKETQKRLADAMKGICSITSMSRTVILMMMTEHSRIRLVKALCESQSVLNLLPSEEIHKVAHYFHTIFSQFRSKFFSLPRTSEKHQKNHESCIVYLLNIMSSKTTVDVKSKEDQSTNSVRLNTPTIDNSTANSVHWRNRLMAAWFILTFIDESDLKLFDIETISLLWKTCFEVIRHETGQPLQRVSLGILGRLVTLALTDKDFLHLSTNDEMHKTGNKNIVCLQVWLRDQNSIHDLVSALVFDHKEDSSVGGGHDAQWAAGVEEIMKDASSNVAPKILFPFQRTNRLSSTFKLQHSQLVHSILLLIGRSQALAVSKQLLHYASEIAASPPSEDQKNQQCTSAEIFAGVSRALLLSHNNIDELKTIWSETLLPFLDDVIPKISSTLVSAYFDALRYCIHHQPPSHFIELTKWIISNVKNNLWQHKKGSEIGVDESEGDLPNSIDSSSGTIDGFASQSKLLLLVSSILIELDPETELGAAKSFPWYTGIILTTSLGLDQRSNNFFPDEFGNSWRLVISSLLPCLLNALGHPYEKCREHIAGCLFRICYCHKKILNKSRSLKGNESNQSMYFENTNRDENEDTDAELPGTLIIKHLSSIISLNEYSFKEKYRALVTTRKFIVYCVHLGDCKNEYSEYIIPLLPLCFEAVKSTESNEENANASNRMLEAEVVKGYRYNLAEVSVACTVSYFGTQDISRVLDSVEVVSRHQTWQVRQAAAHFLRCFQGCHKFLFTKNQRGITMEIVTNLLADERREVSNAAMSALTGVLSSIPQSEISSLVTKYIRIANKSLIKKKRRGDKTLVIQSSISLENKEIAEKEKDRSLKQQTSVFFLCASILAQPYNTPSYVPAAIAAISKHSFEKRASLGVRDTVKMCCGEFKRTHMSDNWDFHKKKFTDEQLDALDDVVSTPHYYA